MVGKVSSATDHGLFKQLGIRYVSIDSVMVEDAEDVEEAGVNLHDSLLNHFARNPGRSYTVKTLTGLFAVRQRWVDPRLVGLEGCELSLDAVWSPRLIFYNSGRRFATREDVVQLGPEGAAGRCCACSSFLISCRSFWICS